MAYYVQKDPDLLAADRIYKKIISSGRDTGRYSSPSPSCSVGRRSSHSKTWKSGNPSVKTGHSTPRGSSVLGEKHMNRHFPDTSEAAFKRTHDGAATQRSLSPTSTIRTGQSNKKRFVSSNQGSVKQSTGLAKKDKHLTGVPVEKKILDIVNSDRWNLSYQALRLEKEWTELDKRRDMKRNAEIVKHRVDNMYLMSGSGIRLKPKYDVNEIELQQLKELSNARQELRSKTRKNQAQIPEEDSSPHFNTPQVSSVYPHPMHTQDDVTLPSDFTVTGSPRPDQQGPLKQIPGVSHLSWTDDKSLVHRCESPESGIQADDQREDELQFERGVEKYAEIPVEGDEMKAQETDLQVEDLELHVLDFEMEESWEKDGCASKDRPVSRIEIRKQPGTSMEDKDMKIMDIFNHQLASNKDLCMAEMARSPSDKQKFEQMEDDTPPARESSSHKIHFHIRAEKGSYTILPFSPYEEKTEHTGYRCGRGPPLPKKKKNCQQTRVHLFPIRKSSSRFIAGQPPVPCKCRQDPHTNIPSLSVSGQHIQLANRVM